jgi:hypothetical protein
MPNSNGSSIVTIKPKAKYRFCNAGAASHSTKTYFNKSYIYQFHCQWCSPIPENVHHTLSGDKH